MKQICTLVAQLLKLLLVVAFCTIYSSCKGSGSSAGIAPSDESVPPTSENPPSTNPNNPVSPPTNPVSGTSTLVYVKNATQVQNQQGWQLVVDTNDIVQNTQTSQGWKIEALYEQ